MDKYELRRTALTQLVNNIGRGGISAIAEKIGKDPSYVSRMLYPENKAGHKRIGEDTAEAISVAYPHWLCLTEPAQPIEQIDEIYRARLGILIKQFGSQSNLADAIEKSTAQISQWRNGHADSKTGRPRCMDRKTARQIESKLGLPAGWFDQPIGRHDSTISSDTGTPSTLYALMVLDSTFARMSPAMQPAAKATLQAWLNGNMNLRDASATIDSLVVASKASTAAGGH